MVIISNPSHPLYKKIGKLQDNTSFKDLSQDEVPVLINDELLFFHPDDITQSVCKKNLRVPNSRKEFYIFIHNTKTKKSDVVEVVRLMSQAIDKESNKKILTFKESEHKQESSYNLNNFVDFINTKTTSKSDIILELRTKREEGMLEFNLPNNNLAAGVHDQIKENPVKKKYFKKKTRKSHSKTQR
jgi:hypothetical protein